MNAAERLEPATDEAIRVRGLAKSFGENVAVDALDWTVPTGEACALLGPNGAGKSTVLRILMGFAAADAGAARVLGRDPWDAPPAHRRRVAFVPEVPHLPSWARVDTLVEVHRGAFPRWDATLETELRELLAIDGTARVGKLSKGQNRRVHLLLALCQGADLMLLDEPGSGLDVHGRRELLGLLSRWMAESGRTLVFSTHIVSDVERIASLVSVLSHGRLVAHAPLDELHDDVKTIELSRAAYDRVAERLERAGVLERRIDERRATVVVRHFRSAGEPALRSLATGDVVVSHSTDHDLYLAGNGEEARVLHMGLEDAFLALSNEPSDQGARA